jgi:hypothetical protein
MDPNAWFREMRELIKSRDEDDLILVEHRLDDMQEWLAKGGFVPELEPPLAVIV